jgi:hypothetical protein
MCTLWGLYFAAYICRHNGSSSDVVTLVISISADPTRTHRAVLWLRWLAAIEVTAVRCCTGFNFTAHHRGASVPRLHYRSR